MRLFAKRTARWSTLLAATAFLLVACEPEVPLDPRTDYWAGSWTCDEQTGDLAPQVYTVEVDLGADPDGVTVSGLYNQGLNFTVLGTVSGTVLTIPEQTINGFTLSGSGTYSVLTDQVTYSLVVNDGGSADYTSGRWTR
jgi:hypothetical protein